MGIDLTATATTKARYNRLAPIYDWQESFMEALSFRHWRKRLWTQVKGPKILEVGVGTGKNMPYYPAGAEVTALDLSDGMLAQARKRAAREGVSVDLQEMDVQDLRFESDSFDTAVATFVLCSVPDPVRGLRELGRVVRPDGRILLLEHVRVNWPGARWLMDLLNPIVVRVTGANINRQTADTVRRAGLTIERVETLALTYMGLVKLIVARPGLIDEDPTGG